MSWTIKYSSKVLKDFKKLDPQAITRIRTIIDSKIATLDDPKSLGKDLKAYNLWRYRVGDYRIIAEIRDKELVILVIKIGHRENVYEKL